MRVVELVGVYVSYGDRVVLEDVNLVINKREFLGLIGPNGGGKTTLLKVILGFIKPCRGTVRVFGVPVEELDGQRGRIGYVPQHTDFDPRFPITVEDVVLMGRLNRTVPFYRPSTEDRRAALDALEMMGMADLRDRQIGQLSGGQLQRVLIARALVSHPELLLLDEPTTGVDIHSRDVLLELIDELRAKGTTVVMASHDVGVISPKVSRLVCVNRRVHVHDEPYEAIGEGHLKSVYGCEVELLMHGKVPHRKQDSHWVVEEHDD